jgi:hypothetical protein
MLLAENGTCGTGACLFPLTLETRTALVLQDVMASRNFVGHI